MICCFVTVHWEFLSNCTITKSNTSVHLKQKMHDWNTGVTLTCVWFASVDTQHDLKCVWHSQKCRIYAQFCSERYPWKHLCLEWFHDQYAWMISATRTARRWRPATSLVWKNCAPSALCATTPVWTTTRWEWLTLSDSYVLLDFCSIFVLLPAPHNSVFNCLYLFNQ